MAGASAHSGIVQGPAHVGEGPLCYPLSSVVARGGFSEAEVEEDQTKRFPRGNIKVVLTLRGFTWVIGPKVASICDSTSSLEKRRGALAA